ncbi:ATP-binding protein [Methanocalculus sp.]|uniref:ATP-binding protein n=1 Tax=Methanocalculus sp. TaxID=2004547 RepID=UPI0025F78636|nr:ATP-binding protein [Methanocalculus sp.]
MIDAEPMIEKVFMNLYDNCLRHAEGVTGITIQCQETDAGLLITWEDDGPGNPI